MLKRLNTTKFIIIAVLTTILFGCASGSKPVKEENRAISLVSAPLSAAQYLDNAANAQSDEQRDRFMLLAAHAYINKRDSGNASKVLSSIKANLTQKPEILAEHQYLTARVLELNRYYDKALQKLDYPSQWQLANWQMASYHQLRAQLYKATKQPIEQAKELTLLSTYLPQEQANEVNDQIWAILQPFHEQTLLAFTQDNNNPIFAGWLQLGYIAKHYAAEPQVLVQRLGDWQYENPSHPAARKLPTELDVALNTKPFKPKNIAVLLPLTGSMAALAYPVKQGIISNYTANPNNNVAVNFFDTATGVEAAYQRAVNAGAEFIIGPLLPNELEILLKAEQKAVEAAARTAQKPTTPEGTAVAEVKPFIPIPQLFLNNVEMSSHRNDQFFFALSPMDEASNAAEKMFNDGITSPLLLASNDSTGERMAAAFNDKWQELTGQTTEVHYYNSGDEMKVTVQKALGVIDSKERIARIKALLGNSIKADFRSRRDIDAIYMISNNKDLPLLKPFIDVNFSVFAQPTPLYTTSRARIENNSADAVEELDNLTISDVPLLLQPNDETSKIVALWPTWNNGQKRLYAMGYDALSLVSKLNQMRALPGYQYSGLSGQLSASPNGTIHRQLSWGHYQRGNLKPQ